MVVNHQRRLRVAVKPLQEFLDCVRHTLLLSKQDVTVCLVSDAAITRLNRAFRGKRGPTDVLSFPANGIQPLQSSERRTKKSSTTFPNLRSSASSYLGDIAIAPATARRNARRFARSLPQELRILILHGMLHLAGYDHETDHGEMDGLERRLRRRLGLS